MVVTVAPKKSTPEAGDVIPRAVAVDEDIITVVNPELENASVPILVIELPIVTDVKLVQ